jgi:hypothetical protein
VRNITGFFCRLLLTFVRECRTKFRTRGDVPRHYRTPGPDIEFVIGCAGEFGGSDTCGEPAALVVPWDAGRRRPAALLRHPMSQQREAKDGNRIVRVQIEAQKIAIGHLMTKSRYYKEFQNYSNLSASPDSYVRALEQMLDRFSHKNDRWPVYAPIGPRERLVASLGKVTRFGGLIHEFGDAYEYGCPYTCLCALSGIRTPANPHWMGALRETQESLRYAPAGAHGVQTGGLRRTS